MLDQNYTEIIALYAAIVATGAFFLEVRRWFESGPRLRLRVMPEALLIGDDEFPSEFEQDTFISVTATNCGSLPTTITHMLVYDYENLWSWLRRKPVFTAIVPSPQPPGHATNIPQKLDSGEQWYGMAKRTEAISRRAKNRYFYVGLQASHRRKPFLRRVLS